MGFFSAARRQHVWAPTEIPPENCTDDPNVTADERPAEPAARTDRAPGELPAAGAVHRRASTGRNCRRGTEFSRGSRCATAQFSAQSVFASLAHAGGVYTDGVDSGSRRLSLRHFLHRAAGNRARAASRARSRELRPAYDMFSPRYRGQVSFDSGTNCSSRTGGCFTRTWCARKRRRKSGPGVTLEIYLHGADDKDYRARFTLIRTDGRWWIDDVHWSEEPDERDFSRT